MPDDQPVIESIRSSYDRVADAYAAAIFDELKSKPFDRDVLLRFARETAGRGRVCDMAAGRDRWRGSSTRWARTCSDSTFRRAWWQKRGG